MKNFTDKNFLILPRSSEEHHPPLKINSSRVRCITYPIEGRPSTSIIPIPSTLHLSPCFFWHTHFSHQLTAFWIVAPYGTTIEACHPQTVLWYMGIRSMVEFSGSCPGCNSYNLPRLEDALRIMFQILDETVLWHFKLRLDIKIVNHDTLIFQGHQVKLYQIVETWQFAHTTRQNAILHVFSEDDDMNRAMPLNPKGSLLNSPEGKKKHHRRQELD